MIVIIDPRDEQEPETLHHWSIVLSAEELLLLAAKQPVKMTLSLPPLSIRVLNLTVTHE